MARSATPFSWWTWGGHVVSTVVDALVSEHLDALVSEHLPELTREELARVVALDFADDLDRAVSFRGGHIDLRLAKNSSAFSFASDLCFSSLRSVYLE